LDSRKEGLKARARAGFPQKHRHENPEDEGMPGEHPPADEASWGGGEVPRTTARGTKQRGGDKQNADVERECA